MKAYDTNEITSPEYDDRGLLGGQVVVYETYADERATRACYELRRKPHRNAGSPISSAPPFSAFPSHSSSSS